MKKLKRLKPVVESLEPMVLLSTATAGLHEVARPIAPVAAETMIATPVTLHGTIKGTGTLSGTTLSVHGSGNLGKVGVVSLKASGDILAPPSSLTLSTGKGKLVLTPSSPPLIVGTTGTVTYAISGGTKSYAHATGSGLLTGVYTIQKHNAVTFKLRFS